MLSEVCLALVYPKPKMNILFSKKSVWEPRIRWGFRFLPHMLTFDEFNPNTIAAHDLVVPLTIDDVFYLNSVRHLIENNAIPIPSFDCIQLCHDKYAFAQTLINNNFAAYIPPIADDLPYPFFLKKKIDEGGENSHLVENREQELALLQSENNEDYFRQKFISGGSEFSTYIFFNKQQIVRSITLKHLFEKEGAINGKDPKFGMQMVICPYLDIFTAILNLIAYEGMCCVDYKIIDDSPYIFEINPRFGGNLSPFFFSFIRSLN
jgi:predicted ATP-grasp superfamily ATP-dependent carboligase